MNARLRNIKSIHLLSLCLVMAMILAACAPATSTTTFQIEQPTSTQSSSVTSGITVGVATDPTLGKYLVDDKGDTLYVLTKDAPDASACNAACQANWPPLIDSTVPKVGPGVDASLVSFTTLAGGEKVITYDHRPLYYKATDKKAGDKTGEAINNVWFVVSPAGVPIGSSGAAVGTPTPTAAPSASAATPAPVTEPTLAITHNSTLGDILTANNGITLYAFTEDSADTSNCSAGCQKSWVPLLTNGKPGLAAGIAASMVGTAKLANGSLVLTYNHMPLYSFVSDATPGATLGQGFDNVWFAVSPGGKKVGSVTEVSLSLASNPVLGSYLVGLGGQAVYAYASDKADQSTCTAACAANWPPVLTLGKPTLGNGMNSSLVGTLKLADGSLILTYNHKPLYYFVVDARPADVKGQGIKNIWNVLGADGNIITYLLPKPVITEPTINVTTSSTYGQILTDGNGMTLYVDLNDSNADTLCLGACMQKWTPLYSLGKPFIGTGVTVSKVGTMTTSYGFIIVTYDGFPLYTYKGDSKPGDTTGYGLGSVWYVIGADGQPVVPK